MLKQGIAGRFWVVLMVVCWGATTGTTLQAAGSDQLLSTLQEDMAKFDKIATETKQNVDYMPYVVSTLNGEDLGALGVESLREALQLIPGVDLAVGMAGVRNPIFRGSNPFSFGQSKLIIDGMVVNDKIFGGYNQYLDMPVRLIHRIEVVRGPGSLLSHVNGYAGSIHVITKANRDDGLRPENTVFASVGSSGYRMAGLVAATQKDDFELSTDLYVLSHDQRSDPTVDRFNRSGSADQSLDNYNLGLNFRRGGFRFKGRLADNDSGVSYGQSFSLSNDLSDRLVVRNKMFEVGYQAEIASGVAANVSLGYLDEQRTLQNKVIPSGGMVMMPMPPMMLPNGRYFMVDYGEKIYRARAELVVTHFAGHTITVGSSLERADIEDNLGRTSDDALASFNTFRLMTTDKRRHVTVYADDLWEISERIAIQLGLKLDRYNDVASQTSPRVAMVYRQDEDNIFKLMYSKSFREPSWREQYLNSSMAFFRPNPVLDVESVQAYEAAYIRKLSGARQIKLNVFSLHNDSQIQAPNGAAQYVNHPETDLLGVEVEFSSPVGNKGKLSANYSFVEGENVVGSLANSTRQMVKAAYTHNLTEAWSLSGVLAYVGEKERVPGDMRSPVKDYVTLDLSAQYRYRASGTTVGVGIKNLFDQRYASPAPIGTYAADLIQPGRTIVISLGQEF